MKKLFAPIEQRTGQGAESAVSAIARQGIDAPEIQNLLKAHESLKKSGAAVPGISGIMDDLRSGIVSPFLDKSGRGIIQPDQAVKLSERLIEIEKQTPGSLAKLGFGSTKELNDFAQMMRKLGSAGGEEQTEKILRAGIPGIAVVSASLDQLPNFKNAEKLINYLQREARSGNASAIEASNRIRAKAIEDVLVMMSQGRRSVNLDEILNTMGDRQRAYTLRTLIGDPTFDFIEKNMLPGFRIMAETERTAGRAGTTVGGAQTEELIRGGERTLAALTTGKLSKAAETIIDTLYRNQKYNSLSRLLAESAGTTGLRSKANRLRSMERMILAPSNAAERLVHDQINEALQEDQQQAGSPE